MFGSHHSMLASTSAQLRNKAGSLASSAHDPPQRRHCLQSGTVTVVQRTSSDLRCNPHLHIVAIDGVFAEQADGFGRPMSESYPKGRSAHTATCASRLSDPSAYAPSKRAATPPRSTMTAADDRSSAESSI
jgi:hypothetical protein